MCKKVKYLIGGLIVKCDNKSAYINVKNLPFVLRVYNHLH